MVSLRDGYVFPCIASLRFCNETQTLSVRWSSHHIIQYLNFLSANTPAIILTEFSLLTKFLYSGGKPSGTLNQSCLIGINRISAVYLLLHQLKRFLLTVGCSLYALLQTKTENSEKIVYIVCIYSKTCMCVIVCRLPSS